MSLSRPSTGPNYLKGRGNRRGQGGGGAGDKEQGRSLPML